MNIFIDNNDLEEQYGEQKYKEYLEKENKQMKQDITTMNKEIERLNNIIKKGITEEMKDELDVILKTNQKQAHRIYKAIEYINKHTNNGMFELRSDTNEIEELLNILKGSDKE